jgi:hypothetical protein
MRTKKETEAEAFRRASHAMIAAGWNGVPTRLEGGQEQYWEDWDESLEEATTDLEAENENH